MENIHRVNHKFEKAIFAKCFTLTHYKFSLETAVFYEGFDKFYISILISLLSNGTKRMWVVGGPTIFFMVIDKMCYPTVNYFELN